MAVKDGANQFVWNMRYEDAEKFDGMIMWWANTAGPVAVPGTYEVRLIVDKDSVSRKFQILKDPRVQSSEADLKAQFDFLMDIRNKLSETHQAIVNIRKVNAQLESLKAKLNNEDHDALLKDIEKIQEQMKLVENNLYQTRNRSQQDPLNYPIKLNNKLGHLAALNGFGQHRPTRQELALKEELFKKIDQEIAVFTKMQQQDIPTLNERISNSKIPFINLNDDN